MVIKNVLVDIVVEMYPEYEEFVIITSNGDRLLYLRLLK